jgi:uncharacterized protein (DUF302 family)
MSLLSALRAWCRRDVALALLCLCSGPAFADVGGTRIGDVIVREYSGSFEDVKEQLVFAIEQSGLAVSNVSAVGQMLERTRADLGVSRPAHATAEIVQFCSAATAHAAAQVEPHLIALCPYSLAIYTLAGEDGRVYISHRALEMPGVTPEVAAVLRRSQSLIDGILDAVVP